jgi:hypothetical protein
MPSILSFVLHAIALLAGLVFAASLAVVLVLVLALWGLRAVWARLTGRPIVPFAVRIHPLGGLGRAMRRGEAANRAPRANPLRGRLRTADVTDVEAK